MGAAVAYGQELFCRTIKGICRVVPQKHIATYLGITPESLSRIRSAMKEEE